MRAARCPGIGRNDGGKALIIKVLIVKSVPVRGSWWEGRSQTMNRPRKAGQHPGVRNREPGSDMDPEWGGLAPGGRMLVEPCSFLSVHGAEPNAHIFRERKSSCPTTHTSVPDLQRPGLIPTSGVRWGALATAKWTPCGSTSGQFHQWAGTVLETTEEAVNSPQRQTVAGDCLIRR